MTNKDLSEKIIEIYSYVGDCDDWVFIKKQMMLSISPKKRSLFSKRHPITKEQQTNQFELDIIKEYKKITGIDLIIRKLEERRELGYV